MIKMTQWIAPKADNEVVVNGAKFMVTDDIATKIMELISSDSVGIGTTKQTVAAPVVNHKVVKDVPEVTPITKNCSSALTKALKKLPSTITAAEISAIYDSWEAKGWQWANGRPSTKDVGVKFESVNGVVTGYTDGGKPVFVSKGLNEAVKVHLKAAGFHYSSSKKGWVIK